MNSQENRYVKLPKEELQERKAAVEAAVGELNALGADAVLVKDGCVDAGSLPKMLQSVLAREEAGQLADRESLEVFLQVTLMKMETSLRIQEIRRTADFNRLACSVVFGQDKKPRAGSLESLFAPKK